MDANVDPFHVDVYPKRYQDYVIKILQSKVDYFQTRYLWKDGDDVSAIVRNVIPQMGDEDFTWSMCWKPILYAQLSYEGFLSISSDVSEDLFLLMPKLHKERCVLLLENLHVSKKTRKRCKKYNLSIDTRFEEVLEKCHAHHEHSWLYPPMQTCLRVLNKTPYKNLQVHSIELTDKEGNLVAGELGITVGKVYTSLTGYFDEKGAGTIQLQLLGCLLVNMGFTVWDLGMWIAYKGDLGAKNMPRKEFVVRFRIGRSQSPSITPFSGTFDGKEIMGKFRENKAPKPKEAKQVVPSELEEENV